MKSVYMRYIPARNRAKPASVLKTQVKPMNTNDVLDLETLPESMVIVGGGVIGCEMAGISEFIWRRGDDCRASAANTADDRRGSSG